MEYRLLGPLQVVGDDGAAVSVPAPKRRALLAVLLLHANQQVAVGTLADALWAGDPPRAAISSLRAHVSRLRREIGPVIETGGNGYAIQVSPGALDIHDFEERVAAARHQARSGQLAQAAATYRGALGLWRGNALADFEDDPFAQGERQRLEELRLSAVEERIEVDLGLGRHEDLIAELEGLVAEHPLRERAWDQLDARALRGRQAGRCACRLSPPARDPRRRARDRSISRAAAARGAHPAAGSGAGGASGRLPPAPSPPARSAHRSYRAAA